MYFDGGEVEMAGDEDRAWSMVERAMGGTAEDPHGHVVHHELAGFPGSRALGVEPKQEAAVVFVHGLWRTHRDFDFTDATTEPEPEPPPEAVFDRLTGPYGRRVAGYCDEET